MIGQERLLTNLSKYTIDTFPQSILIVGESGSGKHTLTGYIAENILKLPSIDLSKTLSHTVIDEIYRTSNPCIYFVNLNEISEKEQNILLKFLEEPLKNAFLILLTESTNIVLNTVLNRCILFEMDSYTDEQLKPFIPNDSNQELLLKIVRTPGKLKTVAVTDMDELLDLCNKITTKLKVATLPNTLTISDKINFKDNYSKFDMNLFFDTLQYSLFEDYLKNNNKISYKLYLYTKNEVKKLLDKRLNKEIFFDNYLINIWKISREG